MEGLKDPRTKLTSNQNFPVSPQQSKEVIKRNGRSYELRATRASPFLLLLLFAGAGTGTITQLVSSQFRGRMLTVLISATPLLVPTRLWEHRQKNLELYSRFSGVSFSFIMDFFPLAPQQCIVGTSGQESFNQMWKFGVTRV